MVRGEIMENKLLITPKTVYNLKDVIRVEKCGGGNAGSIPEIAIWYYIPQGGFWESITYESVEERDKVFEKYKEFLISSEQIFDFEGESID
jgi:hypothetical protein